MGANVPIMSVRFSEPMNSQTLNKETIQLFDAQGNVLAIKVRYEITLQEAIIEPAEELLVGETYRIVLNGECEGTS